jgi:hypothetical protein
MGMMNRVYAGVVLLGGLIVGFGAEERPANAALIPLVTNSKVDDGVQPVALVNNGPLDCSFLGLPFRNMTADELGNIRLSLPLAALGPDGLPATDSPGELHWKAIDPTKDFTYDAITQAPVGGTIVIPTMVQNESVFDGSLFYGTLSFGLDGLQLKPNQSIVIAFDFAPQNGSSAIVFVNDGTNPNTHELNLGAEPAYYLGTDWSGPLDSTGPFGPNQCAAFDVYAEPTAVPEPATWSMLAAGAACAAVAAGIRRRQDRKQTR